MADPEFGHGGEEVGLWGWIPGAVTGTRTPAGGMGQSRPASDSRSKISIARQRILLALSPSLNYRIQTKLTVESAADIRNTANVCSDEFFVIKIFKHNALLTN